MSYDLRIQKEGHSKLYLFSSGILDSGATEELTEKLAQIAGHFSNDIQPQVFIKFLEVETFAPILFREFIAFLQQIEDSSTISEKEALDLITIHIQPHILRSILPYVPYGVNFRFKTE